ncbi:MAG: 2-keto-4-pentenoate hydratase [Persicimonas sp.]
MNPERTTYFAEIVDSAAVAVTPITMLTAEEPDMTLEQAYDIQRASIARRLERGEELVGMKMGLTSKAKMEQVGVHSPIYGHLTGPMVAGDGDELDRDNYIHPRVEPEICFVLGRDLEGPTTPVEALDAVESVCAALEVIDSRFRDFKFTIIDVVADNASSSTVVLGNKRMSPHDLDLGNLGMVLEHNGEVAKTGSSAAIFEHPLRSLAELANLLAERGEKLHAGQIVMSGGATAAIHVDSGDHVRAQVDQLGTVELFVK